jgi:hypothetical protein
VIATAPRSKPADRGTRHRAKVRRTSRRANQIVSTIAASILLAGCALNGDFDRVRPSLVSDDMHAWVGVEAARGNGVPASHYPLTDDERLLRDLAFPLIEPPYDRNKWHSVLYEYGIGGSFRHEWAPYNVEAYWAHLIHRPYRSATARYSQLDDDIRNDVVRIDPFFGLARRVLDIDQKREKSLAYVSGLRDGERINATARVAENVLVVGWVQCSLAQRAASYRFALERLVIETPAPMAVEAERSLKLMEQRAVEARVVDGRDVCGHRAVAPVLVSKG